jgi:error-prone DNA polymerase
VPITDAGVTVSGIPHVPAALEDELLALRRSIDARPSRYVELTCRTNFSFLSGATSPEAMVFRAAELGYDAIAITDRDGIYGIVRACEEAAKRGIRIILGCEITLETDGMDGVPDVPGKPTTLTLLVESHKGYSNLCKILTESHRRHPKSLPMKRAKDLDEDELPRNVFAGLPLSFVCKHAEGLWALADAALPIGDLLRAFGPRLSIEVHLHKDGEDRARVHRVLEASRTYGVAVCATNRVLFARPQDKPILDVLHCIREGKTLDEAGRDLLPNTEAHLKDEEEMLRLFSLHPEWIARSRFIADRCRFSIKELSYRFPYEISDLVHRDFRGEPGETAMQALTRLTWEGAHGRYGEIVPKKVEEQLEKELALIEKLEVAPYFLSVRAIIDIARRRDILCQGRGSAANSAVCFCLGITAVDPARSNMLFERFLSAERREPPDIDVDFEHERREEVIQEIYETYGRDRAAMVCEIVSYRSKSALREVGKIFGFSLEQVERLSAVVSWWDGVSAVSEKRLSNAGFSAHDPRVRQTLAMARAVQGFPRHLSIHVGGFILSAAPLTEVAPIEPATMQDRTIVPWDKDDIDTLGFFKVDVLGLGMLTAIRKCLDLVKDVAAISVEGYAPSGVVQGTAIERLAKIPAEDPVVYDALCNADTVGVFQIESRA